MIYTVTLNPSIDYVVYPEEEIKLGELNRFEKNDKFPGGKGINVSRILKELDKKSVALGFLGGFTGEFINSKLAESSIETQFIKVEEDTRINVKIKGSSETEINGAGPHVDADKQEALLKQMDNLESDDVVILSGSKPSSLPDDFYQTVIGHITEKKASFVIDTTGKELMESLGSHPLLAKPNIHELEALYSVEIKSKDDLIHYGKDLIEKGAEHVIVSMGKDGAVLFTNQGIYQGKAEAGKLINSVGAGDSMVAGFVGLYQDTKDAVEAFRYSLACGSATAFNEDLATKEDINKVLKTITIEKWEEK
ncbi:MAG: 1-phosphofructokinase [Alkalibacterium sp.]|nr:1-phosphofructokinase [Alkalibacterium sp.]TVP92869.1 MAG: 1-phosphofructokinase [Alkalibacterium sp.]